MAHGARSVDAIRGRNVTEHPASEAVSLRLDTGELDHLSPFLNVIGDQLAKLGGRDRKRIQAEVVIFFLGGGPHEPGIDLLLWGGDRGSGRIAWRGHSPPEQGFVTLNEAPGSRKVGGG